MVHLFGLHPLYKVVGLTSCARIVVTGRDFVLGVLIAPDKFNLCGQGSAAYRVYLFGM